MKQHLAQITLLVKDYEEAILYFTDQLGFELLEDTRLNPEKRWVLVRPKGKTSTAILLAKAANNRQKKAVGNQSGGRVFLFLNTDDFWRDYNTMLKNGVKFTETPRKETYGTVVVFQDLYGNLWDLMETDPQVN